MEDFITNFNKEYLEAHKQAIDSYEETENIKIEYPPHKTYKEQTLKDMFALCCPAIPQDFFFRVTKLKEELNPTITFNKTVYGFLLKSDKSSFGIGQDGEQKFSSYLRLTNYEAVTLYTALKKYFENPENQKVS